jgi:uncharacterized protein (TIGR02271 family)
MSSPHRETDVDPAARDAAAPDAVAGRDPAAGDGVEVIRHEEELEIGTGQHELGAVRAKKRVESEPVEHLADRAVEHADMEREPAAEADSGEVLRLPDGSISIPVFEEQLVVSKKLVVRERVVIRKHRTTEQHRIEAELRREHVEIEADPGVTVVEEEGGRPA